MTKTTKLLLLVTLFVAAGWTQSIAQCGTFANSSDPDAAETAHVLYRQSFKKGDFAKALPNWEKAFKMAPAADGKRSTQYLDGIDMYKDFFQKATDDTKKAEYAAKIKELYDQMAECYPKEASYAYGRKAYDMLYTINEQRDQILTAGLKAFEVGNTDVEYIVFYPVTEAILYLFPLKQVTKEQARDAYQKMMDIADANIKANKDKASWEKTKADTKTAFIAIEDYIFDCDYFKAKLLPVSDPNNFEIVKDTYTQLIAHGCTKADPDIASLAAKYDALAASINAQRLDEFNKNNPAVVANNLYKDGKYRDAVAKYNEAIAAESDNSKKASHYCSIASIEGRKLGQMSKARAHAYQAAKLRPGWGKPYMLIGDLYAKSTKKCGDAFQSRLVILAAVDKYAHAKAIDSSVAGEANKKIASYRKHFPEKGDVHMRGLKVGQSVKVKCWIGENVKLRIN